MANELAVPISSLLNRCFDQGKLPQDWKTANVSCIFKKGIKTEPGNYRPVSLTCVLCKLAESYVKQAIYTFLEERDIFTDSQHGFRKARSCVTQLIQVTEALSNSLDNGEDVDLIYLDFQKAFDKVPHLRLLNKLKGFGISGKIHNFITDFLTDRKQRVVVNGSPSTWSSVKSGIPQGSILGPLLFILFINDLPDGMLNDCKMFADDTKLYGKPGVSLQDDLDKAVEWAKTWQMKFNAGKCTVLHMGKNNPKNTYFMKDGNGDKDKLVNRGSPSKPRG